MSKVCKELLDNQENLNEKIKDLFSAIDTNKSSDIDKKELRQYIKMLYEKSGKKITNEIIDKFIKNFDKDKSGTLDLDEFKEFATQVLKSYSH